MHIQWPGIGLAVQQECGPSLDVQPQLQDLPTGLIQKLVQKRCVPKGPALGSPSSRLMLPSPSASLSCHSSTSESLPPPPDAPGRGAPPPPPAVPGRDPPLAAAPPPPAQPSLAAPAPPEAAAVVDRCDVPPAGDVAASGCCCGGGPPGVEPEAAARAEAAAADLSRFFGCGVRGLVVSFFLPSRPPI